MRIFLFILLIVCTFSYTPAQETNHQRDYYSTFILADLSTREQCKVIDSDFRSMEGVTASRTDLNTRRYFIVYSNSNFDRNWFESYFKKKYDLNISCYNSGIQGIDRPAFNTYQTCPE